MLKKFFKFKLKLRHKIIIYLLITSFIPLLFFGIETINESHQILKNEINSFTNDLLVEKQKNLGLMLNNSESLITNILEIEEIKHTLLTPLKESSTFNKLKTQAQIETVLSNYSNINGLVSIDILSISGEHYHVGDTLNVSGIDENLKGRLFKEDLASSKKVVWNGIEDNINKNSTYKKVVTFSSIVKSTDHITAEEKPVGIVILNFDIKSLLDIISENSSHDVSYTLIDGKNRIVCSTAPSPTVIKSSVDSLRNSTFTSKFFNENINNVSYWTNYSIFQNNDWIIYSSTPISVLDSRTSAISKTILFLLITSFVLIIFLQFIISKHYISPINKITNSFKLLENGHANSELRLKTHLKDEIGDLVNWFNAFIENLQATKAAEAALQKELRNDFRRTVENLEHIVFKLKLNRKSEIIITMFEGKLAHKLFEDTTKIIGLFPSDIFIEENPELVSEYCRQAFNGESPNFEATLNYSTFYITLSPIIENNVVVEVVGSAIDISNLKQAENKIRFMAYYDPLTKLPNRLLYNDRVNSAILHAKRNELNFPIMFLDLDNFKLINDTLGHKIGDILLQNVADRLLKCVNEDDTVARMGGDEFIVLLPYLHNPNQIENMAKRILASFNNPFLIENHEFYISTSIGIGMYPIDGTDIDILTKNADTAMYKAKEQGRNNYQFFTASMNNKVIERLNMEISIRKALERNEFNLFYQPKVDLKTGKISSSEALIRWFHPKSGFIAPSDFIPIAEDCGLITAIGEWVLETACAQNKAWIDAGFENLRVAVNISAKQFQQQNFVDTVTEILNKTGLNPSLLELEITENSLMQDTEKNIATIQKLKSMNIKISLDDFGTGFSSLSYLAKFSPDILKIDRSFINDMESNNTAAAITVSIINMAHILDLTIVAEGVETKSQLDFLITQNCTEIQGYYFSKPVSSTDFTKLLQDKKSL